MASNYSEDQVSMMIEKYSANPSRDTVDELADILEVVHALENWQPRPGVTT